MIGSRWHLFWGVATVTALCLGAVLAFSPSSLAQPAQPIAAAAPSDSNYVGAETCKGCHEDQFKKFSQTRMGRMFLFQARDEKERAGCEACHGPGKAHVDAGGGKGKGGLITFAKDDPTPVEKRNQTCLVCHTKSARIFWQGSAHESRDIACTDCHRLMENVSPKNQLTQVNEIETCGTCHLQKQAVQMRSSHMPVREGKMTCSSCHNPHGTVTPALLKGASLNATCFQCHQEKRGPFLWTHQPVLESCSNCHDPHGSNHDSMLKVTRVRLCQQCHTEAGHQTHPRGRSATDQKFVMGRGCSDCHVNIHGSNHPAGFKFTR